MRPKHTEVLSAFFDGEAVDTDALAASLQEPDAIEFLVEFARLRRAVHDDASRPTEEFCDGMRERLARGDRRRLLRYRVLKGSLAASLILAAAAGGFSARALFEKPRIAAGAATAGKTAVAPLTPGRELPAVPGTESAAAPSTKSPVQRPVRTNAPIPSPTLRIRFAEWRDTVL